MINRLAVISLVFSLCCSVVRAQQPELSVSLPLHTIHSGEVTVPLGLRYTPSHGWALEAGAEREDDAGNRVEFTDSTILWPQGHIVMRTGGMQVYDAQDNIVKSLGFERLPDGRLSRLLALRDTVEFSYIADGILLRRPGEGETEFRFDSLDRVVSVACRRAGGSCFSQELDYSSDTLMVLASDETGLLASSLFIGAPQVDRVEEYDASGSIRRSTAFHYQGGLPAGETIQVYGRWEVRPVSSSRRFRYRPGSIYPSEETLHTSDGRESRATFSYASRRPGALLSLTRWEGDRAIDSTRLVYSDYPGWEGRTIQRPSAILYGRSGERLDTCARLIPYDFNGVHTYRTRWLKRVSPDPSILRQLIFSPLAALQRKLKAFIYSTGLSFDADPIEGDGFLFDQDGAFLSRIRGADGQVLFCQGFGREPVKASLADPDYDSAMIDYGCSIQMITQEDMDLSMRIFDACNPDNHGLFRGCRYLYRESGYGGLIDPAVNAMHQVFSRVYYISSTLKEGVLAHNNFNYGNLLWGAAARAAGVPLCITIFGSHWNNFFLSPDNRWHLDSRDDILSIRVGYNFYSLPSSAGR